MYKIGRKLGEGSYGEVRLATHRQSKSKRAVKVIKKDFMNTDEQTKLINEINILKEMDHPNILPIFEYFSDPLRFYIVTDHI